MIHQRLELIDTARRPMRGKMLMGTPLMCDMMGMNPGRNWIRMPGNLKCSNFECDRLSTDVKGKKFDLFCEKCMEFHWCSQTCMRENEDIHKKHCNPIKKEKQKSELHQKQCYACGSENTKTKCNKCNTRFCDRFCLEFAWKHGDHKAKCKKASESKV